MGVVTATVDGYAGPGIALQGKTFSNISKFEIDAEKYMLNLTDVNGKVFGVAISTAVTMTVVISGGNYTITVAD